MANIEDKNWTYSYTRPPVYSSDNIVILPAKKRDRLWVHILLFITTFLTTTIAGAFLVEQEFSFSLAFFVSGFPFSIPLLLILGCHEMGHYFASKKHGLDATLPFFIPGPTLIGTFGAVIKIRSQLRDRRMLFDVGIAGPIAGFVVALPVLLIGYMKSSLVPVVGLEMAYEFGESLLSLAIGKMVFGDVDGFAIYLHPTAFAGWIGMLVTSLNLIPIGRLDGGHIAYAFFGPFWNKVTLFIFGLMLVLGFFWQGWLVWAIMIFLVIKIKHPATSNDSIVLDRKRKYLFWFSVLLFLVTFMPVPIKM